MIHFKTVRVSLLATSLGFGLLLAQGCGKTSEGDGDGGAAGEEGGKGGKGAAAGKAGKAAGGTTSGGSAGTGTSTGGSSANGGSAGTMVGNGGGAGAGSGTGGNGSGGDAGGGAGEPARGGSGGSAAGSGGASGSGTSGDAGEGGSPAVCSGEATRCSSAGVREVCAGGSWEADPCPLDEPACEDGACVVRGPTMIEVNDYYIDSTEVTVAQYAEFVTAKDGDTSGQPAVCSWNDDYEPGDDPGPDTWPVSYVDWCDATAFCQWAGKHLCGRIDGAALTEPELTIANDSQWYRACGGPSNGVHPNGDPECNSNGGFDNTAPVATFPKCEGFYPGLFDMEGNVAEWVDLCDGTDGAGDGCYAMGGSTVDNKSYCDEWYGPEDYFTRDGQYYTTGFRCCSG